MPVALHLVAALAWFGAAASFGTGVRVIADPENVYIGVRALDPEQSENGSWDAAWEVRTRRDGEGWTAEFWIPIRSLNYQADLITWGLSVERRVQRTL